jgi:Na+-driven multidrug efflux pump
VLAAAYVAWPLVCASQPLNTLAFVADGLLFGARDFRFCALLMSAAAAPALVLMRCGAHAGGGLRAVWAGLVCFMLVRAMLGVARVASHTGPWSLASELAEDEGRPPRDTYTGRR